MAKRKNVLFIGGSVNQTSMGHQVAQHLADDYDCYFTPFYTDGLYDWMARRGWLDFSILGGRFQHETEAYLARHNLPVDYRGEGRHYHLVVIGSDLLVPDNIRDKKVVLIQEGMTDPETVMFYLVKWFKLPRYLASTASNGLSDQYHFLCVASEGYRDFFIKKGIKPEKIAVTGIPNYDNAAQFLDNDFPYHNYVLVATSDARETFKRDNRRAFIRRARAIAGERRLIFKLHPNEKFERAISEINEEAPAAMVLTKGAIEPMIANCDVLITQYSSVVYLGLALDKEVHSYFDIEILRRLTPIQNGGTSAANIADVCRSLLLDGLVDSWEALCHGRVR